MKSNVFTIITCLIVFGAFIISCKKSHDENENTTADIQISSPTDSTVVQSNDTLNIRATITAMYELHGYYAILVNQTTQDTIWETELDDHQTGFSISSDWICMVSDTNQMQLRIEAELDHEGNTVSKSVNFVAIPE